MKMIGKRALSFLTVLFIYFFSLGCGGITKTITTNSFKDNNKVEDQTDTRNYIEKNDGTKIYTDNIVWKSGLLTKNEVMIDGQKFKTSDIKGFRRENVYNERYGNGFVTRIVHGKINVYTSYSSISSNHVIRSGNTSYSSASPRSATGSGSMPSQDYTSYYYQQGEDGKLILLEDLKDIQEAVKGCPEAVQMADISRSQMWKRIKANRSYLNEVFETYNNDCKPVR